MISHAKFQIIWSSVYPCTSEFYLIDFASFSIKSTLIFTHVYMLDVCLLSKDKFYWTSHKNGHGLCKFPEITCAKILIPSFIRAWMKTKSEVWDINVEYFLRNLPFIYNVHVPPLYWELNDII